MFEFGTCMPAPRSTTTPHSRAPLPVGAAVLSNSRDLGAWYKGSIVRSDACDGGVVLYTVQYDVHRIVDASPSWVRLAARVADTEAGIPESHVCPLGDARARNLDDVGDVPPADTANAAASDEKRKPHDIELIVDCSGSMGGLLRSTVSGVNTFLGRQKVGGVTGSSRRVGLHTFSNVVRCVWEDQPLRDKPRVNAEDLRTGGGTALLDAIGCTLSGKEDARPRLVCVVTDGHENASRTWTHKSVKALIARLEARGWDFLFLGANMDAVSAGGSLGFSAGKCATWSADARGVSGAFAGAAASANRASSFGKASSGFSAVERAACLSNVNGGGKFGGFGGGVSKLGRLGGGGFAAAAGGGFTTARGGGGGFGQKAGGFGGGKPGFGGGLDSHAKGEFSGFGAKSGGFGSCK